MTIQWAKSSAVSSTTTSAISTRAVGRRRPGEQRDGLAAVARVLDGDLATRGPRPGEVDARRRRGWRARATRRTCPPATTTRRRWRRSHQRSSAAPRWSRTRVGVRPGRGVGNGSCGGVDARADDRRARFGSHRRRDRGRRGRRRRGGVRQDVCLVGIAVPSCRGRRWCRTRRDPTRPPATPSARVRTCRRRRMGPERRATFAEITASQARRNRTDSLAGVPRPLTLLTVHAHPDDEASKGAATVAKYHAEGVTTVLVCCTGGEEGELQNPGLREPGRPFHGLTPETEKAKLAELRPLELAESARLIGFDARRDARLPRLRHAGQPDQRASRVVPPGGHRRGHRPARRGDPPRAPAGRAHVRRRPARLPASRPPAGARHLGAGVRPGRRPRLVSRARRAVPAVEALLHGRGRGPGCSRCTRR